eukprot:TRINITY_DN24739_c0_g1_i1.p1 TRINITY_DN24739_c0_g1~~TRINITY_DN24739_c0_g1_i1.p1  ORF type:complete len:152 (-),score=5.78 TRINITY_DN24739_c0_g1_i1:155-610(-)
MLCGIYFVISSCAQILSAGSPFFGRLPSVWLQRLLGTCEMTFCRRTSTFTLTEASFAQGIEVPEVPGVNGSSIILTPPQAQTVRFWLSAINVCTAALYMVSVCTFVGLVTKKEPHQSIDRPNPDSCWNYLHKYPRYRLCAGVPCTAHIREP